MKTCNWIKEIFFLWFCNGYSMIHNQIGGIRDPFKQDVALDFCKNQNKVISISTETHINHIQIHYIRNNWLGSNFFSPGDSHTEECLSCFIWVLKVSLRLTLIQKGGLCPLRLLPLVSFKITPPNECVYNPSGIAPGNS